MGRPIRVGAMMPSTNPTVEPDFYTVMPREITMHFERMWNGVWGSQTAKPKGAVPEGAPGQSKGAMFGMNIQEMNQDVERGARSLANVTPDLLVYACTAGTFYKGSLAYDCQLVENLEQVTGVPTITAMTSSVEAMRFMGTRRISVAGPYRTSLLKSSLKPVLEEAGFEVLSAEGDPLLENSTSPHDVAMQEPSAICDFVPTVVHKDADTVFLPATGWRALEAVEELEQTLEKTVITVNQAAIWMTLRKVGWTEPIQVHGRLLRSFTPVAEGGNRGDP